MPAVWTLTTTLLVVEIVAVVVLVRRLDDAAGRLARGAQLAAELRRELPALRDRAERFRNDLDRIDRRVSDRRTTRVDHR